MPDEMTDEEVDEQVLLWYCFPLGPTYVRTRVQLIPSLTMWSAGYQRLIARGWILHNSLTAEGKAEVEYRGLDVLIALAFVGEEPGACDT